MFADDTNIALTAKTSTELKLATTPELSNLNCWLSSANRLSLNVATEDRLNDNSKLDLTRDLNTQCDEICIRINDEMIRRVDHTKSMGLIPLMIGFLGRIMETKYEGCSAIGALKRIWHFISANTALQIYNALILTHFDHCSSVWDCLLISGQSSEKPQKLRNRASGEITS